MFDAKIVKRFWGKVGDTTNSNACWEWQGAPTTGGYGFFRYLRPNEKKPVYGAHRFSWELHFGKIPKGLLVCHTCDNPGCVNPGHFFLGTIYDNSVDMVMKGITRRGEQVNFSKLTYDQVTEMKILRAEGWSMPDLAKKYGIGRMNVSRILRGINWKYHKLPGCSLK